VAADSSQENYYRLLNVATTATTAEITRAYRIAVKRAHPDRALPERRQAAEEITKELNRAFGTLSDPAKRTAYDRTIMRNAVQDQIMNRYVSGLGGSGANMHDPFARNLKRTMTPKEHRERRQSDRSAMYSIFSAFLVVLLGGIGLLALFALVTYAISLF
jgi:DnaJ-class molecular chaperone